MQARHVPIVSQGRDHRAMPDTSETDVKSEDGKMRNSPSLFLCGPCTFMARFSTLCTARSVAAALLLSSAAGVACTANAGRHDGRKRQNVDSSSGECCSRLEIVQSTLSHSRDSEARALGAGREMKRSLLRGVEWSVATS